MASTSASNNNNPQLKGFSSQHLESIYQYVTGLENMTGAELSEPILRPGLQDTYYLFVIQYAILSLLGIVANIWIICYIIKYKLFHENMHAFFVNLCVCHFVQSAFVLPITLVVIIVHNWILGQFMCYFVPMLQDIPLHAALLTHILIAWDRMRWLNDPMNSRFPSFVCSCATWLTGMVIALPYPIYTTYLDLGLYIKRLHDVGICVVNLVDDSQEYTRGLFLLMYVAPSVILAYLYIHTSKDLHPPDGELSVMMYEQRAEIIAHQQPRNSTISSKRSAPFHHSFSRSYDLYDAEVDASREQRTQFLLGTMAACEIICIGPLMVLRFARQQIEETYENSSQFDITYLMLVWIAFLPTVIIPCIYCCWILSGRAKDRLWHYFRLSARRCESENKLKPQRSNEHSITQENTTESMEIETRITVACDTPKSSDGKKLVKPAPSIYSATNALKTNRSIARSNTNQKRSVKTKSKHLESPIRTERTQSLADEMNNSCSNITASTYCNDNGISTSSGIGLDFESITFNEKKSNCEHESILSGISTDRHLHKSQELFDTGNQSLRRESSSTYEQDMDIIDLLERKRSIDLNEMMERERRIERIRRKQSEFAGRTNSSVERHRKLPDITKITMPNSPKCTLSTEQQSVNFPNFVFTHQYNEFAEACSNRNRNESNDGNSVLLGATATERHSTVNAKRNSIVYDDNDIAANNFNRVSRARSIDSRKSSTKSNRDSRMHIDYHPDGEQTNNHL